VIDVDAALAIVVVIILFGTLFTLIWWAKGAPPYDDGVGGQWADYLPEPLEDEGWAEPPPRTKPPWERGEPSSREGDDGQPAPAANAAQASRGADDPAETGETDGRDRPGGA
jgi:hypothetical protein